MLTHRPARFLVELIGEPEVLDSIVGSRREGVYSVLLICAPLTAGLWLRAC